MADFNKALQKTLKWEGESKEDRRKRLHREASLRYTNSPHGKAKRKAYYSRADVQERVKEYSRNYSTSSLHKERHRAASLKYASKPESREYYRKYSRERCKTEKGFRDYRNRHLKRSYGISLDEYESMINKQNHACAICGNKEPRGNGSFHVDHNHLTGKVRGLLCNNCNTGIGHLNDDIVLVKKALRYLEEHQNGQL